jgi:hypothetical protein
MAEKEHQVLVDRPDEGDFALALCGLEGIFQAIRLVAEEDERFDRSAQQSLIDQLALAGRLLCEQITDRY